MNHAIIQQLKKEVTAASLSGWRKGIFIYLLIQAGETPESISEAVAVTGFSPVVVRQHLDALTLAIEAGVISDTITVGTALPDEAFDLYYSGISRDPRYIAIQDRDEIQRVATEQGVGVTKALDVAKNPRAVGVAFEASPKTQAAILGALENVSDDVLSQFMHRVIAVRASRTDRHQFQRMPDRRERPFVNMVNAYAVVIAGNKAVDLGTYRQAEQYRHTWNALHPDADAKILADILGGTTPGAKLAEWNELRALYESLHGKISDEAWDDYVDGLYV